MQCLSTDGQVLIPDVQHANRFFSRLKGLLGRTEIKTTEALLIEPCNSVHTLGMKFEIGVVFLSASNQVIHAIENMAPGKLSQIVKGSKKVLELHPETLKSLDLKPNDTLVFKSQL